MCCEKWAMTASWAPCMSKLKFIRCWNRLYKRKEGGGGILGYFIMIIRYLNIERGRERVYY